MGLVSSFLWSNAGFSSLRKLRLGEYDPRYDPAVIPPNDKGDVSDRPLSGSSPPYATSIPHPNRHYSIADYHSAFQEGRLTPVAVAEVLLTLSNSPEHKAAFLSVKGDQVLLAAKASTKRYQEGKAIGPMDGLPIAVKGM